MKYHKTLMCAVAAVILPLGLVGCEPPNSGSESKNNQPGDKSSIDEVISGIKVDEDIRDALPAGIKDANVIKAVSGAGYAPNEFMDEDENLVGFHPDEARAIGQLMGVDIALDHLEFETLIPSIKGERYDLGFHSASITDERKEQVDFVSDLIGGDAFIAPVDFDEQLEKRSDVCGLTVGVGKGTSEKEKMDEQNEKCKQDNDDGVSVKTYPGNQEAILATNSGRVDVSFVPNAPGGWAVKRQPDKFKLVDTDLYQGGLMGIIGGKDTELQKPVEMAVNELIESGVYQQLLENWGIESSAVDDARINPDQYDLP